MNLGQRISRVAPSATLVLVQRAQELRAEGKDIVAFTAGEPDFDTPDHVKAAASDAMKSGFTKYTAAGGIPELKQSIIDKFQRDQSLQFSQKEVVVTNGGKQAIAEAFAVLLDPGDEVIIPAPFWTSYPDMVLLAGGEPVLVSTGAENGYVLTPEQFADAITEKTKAIILNSPSNPTGAGYTREELRALADVINNHKRGSEILVMSDEVYEYITFDNFSHVSFAEVASELREQTLIINAFSKAYSMTGWRVGFAAGPQNIIAAMTTFQSQFTSSICSIAQHAAVAAYGDNLEFPKMLAEDFYKRMLAVSDSVAEIPGVQLPVKPKGAFYAFLRVEELFGKSSGNYKINSASDFANYLLDEHQVMVVPGEPFGDPGAIRLSYAVSPDTLNKGIQRIAEAVSQLS